MQKLVAIMQQCYLLLSYPLSIFRKGEEQNLFKLKDLSYDLAKKVNGSGFHPQHILYIERAGLFIAHEVASYFTESLPAYIDKCTVEANNLPDSIVVPNPRVNSC